MSYTSLPEPSAADLKLIEQCDPSVRHRRRIELAVVRHLIAAIVAAGNSITVNDGDDYPVKRSRDADEIVDACFSVDECWLSVHKGAMSTVLGVVFLVFGNDGWDVICDYHTSLEPLLKATNEYAELLSEGC